MASLAEALKDKKAFPDAQELTLGEGVKITFGELRAYQDATGQDVAKQLEAERQKVEAEKLVVAKAQEEVVNLWTKLQEQAVKQPVKAEPTTTDWTTDPFFAPVAKYVKENIEAQLGKQAEQITQFQKALGLGVKYITDVISEQRYQMLPDEFRKDTPYDKAVKTAAEKKYLDAGGVPDVRKVYEEWKTPRERKAETERIQKEAYDKARADLMASSLARPSGMPVAPTAQNDPNAPKNIRESFQRLKEDPEFLAQIYNLTGQA